jgi:SNF2 family DNA or RNA helicase
MTLQQLVPGLSVTGIEFNAVTTIKAVSRISDTAIEVYYKTHDGQTRDRLLNESDLATIHLATNERPWTFDGDGERFKLAVEAKRIDLAFLFDPMMAVHTANVEPLPHQITAVYESMLPRQPLRFVLADDPGAGKTIMAGLYIREVLMRADARRILIVSPGSLVEQWRDELHQKFGLEFKVYSRELQSSSPSGNPFEDVDQLIVRLDQMSRNDEDQVKICAAGWDLVIFDEAHKLAAHFYGQEVQRTRRFNFAEKLGAATRHLLLMTATPHNGKEEDFQLFLSLLDSDRFYGKFRDGVHKVDPSDLMRRMVKEELVKFDGTPLFPERRAYTVNYQLSDIEAALYERVTDYVKTEMGKADQLEDGQRKGSVGFALTALQRRLASSPEAIFQSLKRRKERLENRLRDEKLGLRGKTILAETLQGLPEDDDDLSADEQEQLDETLVDQASTAQTIQELESEIFILGGLVDQARQVVLSGMDRKWDELSKILQNNPEMKDAGGRQRKIIIFTEHRDTLNYLVGRIGNVLGTPEAIVTIHGGTHRDERQKNQNLFRSDPGVRVLIATDAAGEGVNLQNANLMVNYDLPWNPNRLEQRFGRIHRIGQREVCHLWSLVAKETREGQVYHQLLVKLETESQALKGRVFDILGEVFEETSLKDLLIQAIRYGDLPETRAKLTQKIDTAMDQNRLRELLDRNALAQESMSVDRLFQVREEMEKAEARRLQPFFIRAFFRQAFELLGGTMYPRESDRFEITHVPGLIRDRDRVITGRNTRDTAPVLKRYERVCFTKEAVQPIDKPGLGFAALLHPGHPLMLAVSDIILEQNLNLLRQGSLFIDTSDEGTCPWLLFMLTHEVKDGKDRVISKRLQFVKVIPDGSASFAGWAPHLDLCPCDATERALFKPLLEAPWIKTDLEQQALALASANLAPSHFQEVASRRIAHIDKTMQAVHDRLIKEIDYQTDRWSKLKEDLQAGKDVRVNVENARRIVADLENRLESRKKELNAMRHVISAAPVVLGGALVVPQGYYLQAQEGNAPATFATDAQARSRIEQIAMEAVVKSETAKGWRTVDVSAQKCGWDITSYPPETEGKLQEPRHIEVKGRVKGASTITVTRNEILYAFNQADLFVLAIVLVNEDDSYEGPYFVRNPFEKEPDWGVASVNYDLHTLLTEAKK